MLYSHFKSRTNPIPRQAFTLLEVVVGTLLLASVLVTSMMAFGAHHRQARLADAKREAVAIADELLHQFDGRPEGIPTIGRGVIPGKQAWYWQASIVGTTSPATVPMHVVRFEVKELTTNGQRRSLASVDVVKLVPGAFTEEVAQ